MRPGTVHVGQVRIPGHLRELQVQPTRAGVLFMLGDFHFEVRADMALALSNEIVDAIENRENNE